MSTRFSVIAVVKKVLAILGCLLFVFSFIYPLYAAYYITLAGGGLTYYWSYRADHFQQITFVSHFSRFWFSDYWFSSLGAVGLGIPWILISLFTVQVLALVFGSASVIFNRRILSLAPVLLSLAVMALMVYAGLIVRREYRLGYFLVFPSVVLFGSAFALNEVTEYNNRKILLAVLVMIIAISIAVFLWFLNEETLWWLIIGLLTLGTLIGPIVVALLIAEYAEKRKHSARFSRGQTELSDSL